MIQKLIPVISDLVVFRFNTTDIREPVGLSFNLKLSTTWGQSSLGTVEEQGPPNTKKIEKISTNNYFNQTLIKTF